MTGMKLKRVNYDSSWLMTVSTDSTYPTSTFNLLIDPWLDESEQIDYHAAFSGQKRTTPAIASSISELESILVKEEEGNRDAASSNLDEEGNTRSPSTRIDAILLSHPFTDHMHPQTLKDEAISNRIPFYVTRDSKPALQSLLLGGKQKQNQGKIKIVELPIAQHDQKPTFLKTKGDDGVAKGIKVNDDEESSGLPPLLPSSIEIMQVLPQERFSLLAGPAGIAWSKLHGAVLILWKTTPIKEDSTSPTAHSILYTPHGLAQTSIPTWLKSPTIQNEVIMTSLDKIVLPKWLSGIVNLGLPTALELIRDGVYDAAYLLATHDERKEAKGIVAALIKRYWLGLETPDGENDGLSHLKQKDEDRQKEAQGLANEKLSSSGKTVKVLVLGVGEVLQVGK